ncbi:MAG: GNAT family N-acetyltransferase [Candidatus Bathyarchaeota archaeon]
MKVNDRQDLFAVIYFKTCANEEGGAWLSSRLQDGKILWVEGEAVGYYLANSQQIFEKGSFHCLRQIFVAPQYRNKGYGTIMLYDFLEGREHVVIEAPNEKLLGLLKKNDLVDVDGRSRQISYVTLM